ncbi:hypothetical protein ACFL6I_19255 [candidate division KSB1 bacterium]
MLSNSIPNRQEAMAKQAAYTEMVEVLQMLKNPVYDRVDTINLSTKDNAEKQRLEKRLIELITRYRPVWKALYNRWNQYPVQEELLAA